MIKMHYFFSLLTCLVLGYFLLVTPKIFFILCAVVVGIQSLPIIYKAIWNLLLMLNKMFHIEIVFINDSPNYDARIVNHGVDQSDIIGHVTKDHESVHFKSVTDSVSISCLNLLKTYLRKTMDVSYEDIDIRDIPKAGIKSNCSTVSDGLIKIKKFIQEKSHPTEKRYIDTAIRYIDLLSIAENIGYVESTLKLNYLQLLHILSFYLEQYDSNPRDLSLFNDPLISRDELHSLIARMFYETLRGKNIDENGRDNGGVDLEVCPAGSFSKVIEIMSFFVRGVSIAYITPATVKQHATPTALKCQAISLLIKQPTWVPLRKQEQSFFRELAIKTKKEIKKEYQAILAPDSIASLSASHESAKKWIESDDAKFTAVIEATQKKSPFIIFQKASEIAVMLQKPNNDYLDALVIDARSFLFFEMKALIDKGLINDSSDISIAALKRYIPNLRERFLKHEIYDRISLPSSGKIQCSFIEGQKKTVDMQKITNQAFIDTQFISLAFSHVKEHLLEYLGNKHQSKPSFFRAVVS